MQGLCRTLIMYSCLSVCQPMYSDSSYPPECRTLYKANRLSGVCMFFFCVCGLVCLRHTGPVDMSIQAKCEPCLSNPCNNDGTCSNDPVHYYRCTCPYGFKVHILCGKPKKKSCSLAQVSFLTTDWCKRQLCSSS